MTHSPIAQLSRIATLVLLALGWFPALAQQSTTGNVVVPTLVQFIGVLTNSSGKPLTGVTGMTFSLYAGQEGGAPLWMETQSVQPNQNGQYIVLLGSTTSQGLPTELFTSGEARWLGVQAEGQAEQPRVMLLSVPYALKAADAETLGGKPASSYMLLPANPGVASAGRAESAAAKPGSATAALTGSGTPDFVAKFDSSGTNLISSSLYDNGNVGLGTTSPQGKFHIDAPGDSGWTQYLQTPKTGNMRNSVGFFNSTGTNIASLLTDVNYNNTADFGIDVPNGSPRLYISSSGNVGIGTTSPVSTLEVNGTGTFTGAVTAGSYNIGGNLFDSGSYVNANAFVGFAGNTSTTGIDNTASGAFALHFNTTGEDNTANGISALYANTMGINNTASGAFALQSNNTGNYNTASGWDALYYNTTGSYNTALGYNAGPDSTTPTLINSTAIGAFADVTQSNSLVLGSTYSINGCGVENGCVSTNVGIGTTAPANTLDVYDSGNGGLGTISATTSATNSAVLGVNNSTTTSTGANGGYFTTNSPAGSGIVAENLSASGNNYAAYLDGNVHITGTLSKSTGMFKIDHPLDPANKYLSHSFVESPDMMNVYNGNIRTDKRGRAVVVLPDYFEALNRDFRYQLTVIGQFAQAIVAKEISHNRFTIKTNRPGVEVSWQVTGIRHDAYADAHRIATEEMKPANEQGRYLHPELFGAPPELAIGRLMLPVRETDHPHVASAGETTPKSRNAGVAASHFGESK